MGGTRFSDLGLWHRIAKGFIPALFDPDLARRLTAEQALAYWPSWLKSFAAPTEHGLCGLHKTFDPYPVWALSRFANHNGSCGARSRIQAARDNNNTCHHYLRTIACRVTGWWRRRQQGQQGPPGRRQRSSHSRRSTPCPSTIRKGGEAHAAAERRTEEEVEEVELRMPGSFDFGDHDSGVVGAASVGTVDPFDAVRTLGNLWRRMQVR